MLAVNCHHLGFPTHVGSRGAESLKSFEEGLRVDPDAVLLQLTTSGHLDCNSIGVLAERHSGGRVSIVAFKENLQVGYHSRDYGGIFSVSSIIARNKKAVHIVGIRLFELGGGIGMLNVSTSLGGRGMVL